MNTRSITPLPPADFTPEMGNYRTLQPFRYWCQKVLPLVYDDSLSYYELLCKVVDYLNKTMEDVETLHGDVTNLHTAYVELQSYVNSYFSTLDVQEEINNKLDGLVNDGTLSNLLMPYIVDASNPIIVNSVDMMTNHNKIYVLASNMHIYYWNGENFTDSGNIYGISNNLHGFGSLFYSLEATPEEYRNLNNLLPNTVYWYSYGGGVSNVPVEDFSGCVITYSYSSSVSSMVQIAFSSKNRLYHRQYAGGKWTTWETSSNNLHGFGSLFYSLEATPEEYRNLNNLLPNTVYWYSYGGGVSNVPVEDFSGCVITYSYSSSVSSMVQIAFSSENILYHRQYAGGKWTTWVTNVYAPKTYYVGFSENVNSFNSVIECLNHVKNDNTHKIIYIKSGVYDLLEEIGGMDYINSANDTWDKVQPVVSNVDIIGVGDVVLNFNLETTDYDHWWLFSALNVRGNVKIENITINSSKCRYSIHDESGALYPNSVKKYRNVKCYHDNSEYGGATIGCGYSINTKANFINCVFENTNSHSFSVHEKGNCNIEFENCILITGDNNYALRLSQEGYNYLYAFITNCFIKGIQIRDEIIESTVNGNTEINIVNSYYKIFKSDYPANDKKIISYNYDGTIVSL